MAGTDDPAADGVDGRLGEEHPALPVEVAGQDVEQVDRPLADGAEALGGQPHPAVRRRAVGGGKPGPAAAGPGRQPAGRLGSLGREAGDEVAHPVDVVDVRRGSGQPFLEQHVQHREQHRGVGAGPDKVVLGGDLRGLGAARVEHHHPAAAVLQVADPLGEVGNGHQRAVGRHRVGAKDQEEVGPVEVGDRQQELVAEELPGHELVRDLVDGRRAEPVVGAQALHEGGAVGGEAQRVRVGVAQVEPTASARAR